MAATFCPICREPIGYDRRFYDLRHPRGLVHAVCYEEELLATTEEHPP